MDTSSFQVYNIKKSTSQHLDKSGNVYYEIILPGEIISFGNNYDYSHIRGFCFEIIINMYKSYGVDLIEYLGQLETEEFTNVVLIVPSTRKFVPDLRIGYAVEEVCSKHLRAMLELNPIGQELV